MRSQVITPWVGDGSDGNGFRPRLLDEYPVQRYVDVTGQPSENLTPSPNLFIAEIICDESTLAAIEADSNYQVLWSEDA